VFIQYEQDPVANGGARTAWLLTLVQGGKSWFESGLGHVRSAIMRGVQSCFYFIFFRTVLAMLPVLSPSSQRRTRYLRFTHSLIQTNPKNHTNLTRVHQGRIRPNGQRWRPHRMMELRRMEAGGPGSTPGWVIEDSRGHFFSSSFLRVVIAVLSVRIPPA
jgi:hypothetical protein